MNAERDEMWTMRNGKTIAVADMTEKHAKNALRMMIRKRREERDGTDDGARDVGSYDGGEFYKW